MLGSALNLLFLLQVSAPTQSSGPAEYPGSSRPAITVPRADADITIDGRLDEAQWARAARLTSFSQYQPVDGLGADEATEVRVFYTPRAIYFGVKAQVRGRAVSATLSKRDNISNDDRIAIFLDTFNDKRRAFIFGANALGVQLDGVRTEGAAAAGNMFGGSTDYSPDYQFDSRGEVSDSGYTVEIRIPFKSLRFPSAQPQQWGINIQRDSPATGKTDTWTNARQATNSFLQQSGTLVGIADVDRGVVTEVQPFLTSSYDGARDPSTGSYAYGDPVTKVGANVRLGFSAMSLDATIRPDFSQVEADVGLVTINERFALFIPEKRPFFLEGIELFSTPNQLVYTRRIGTPLAGGKVTGKLGRLGIAYLSALDEVKPSARRTSRALFNVARLRTDFGGSSVAGVTVTDRRDHDTTNTVIAADTRVVFKKLYYVESQLGYSVSQRPGTSSATSPIYKTEFDRTGRIWGFNYSVSGIGDAFQSDAGFVPRINIQSAHGFNRLAWFGSERSLVQSVFAFGGPIRIWRFGDMLRAAPIEGNESFSSFVNFRGGWSSSLNASHDFFEIDPAFADGLYEHGPAQSVVPYHPPGKVSGLTTVSLGFNSPVFKTFNFGGTVLTGQVPIFSEGAEGRTNRVTVTGGVRPSASLRAEGQLVVARITRAYDGSEYSRTVLPRLKLEYQPSRSLFFRVIGEYRSEDIAAPMGAIAHDPLLNADGTPIAARSTSSLRTDWLISFEPRPGTVAFIGYGSLLDRPDAVDGVRPSNLQRASDGLFLKLAYQFRR
ncbi:MAG: DUF5916 domain-containing protein [Gemmatimonadaceae bacterium]